VSGPPRKHGALRLDFRYRFGETHLGVGCRFCHQEVDACNTEIKLGSDRPKSNLLYPPSCQSLPMCLDLRRLGRSN
jgi:hypothetical protein